MFRFGKSKKSKNHSNAKKHIVILSDSKDLHVLEDIYKNHESINLDRFYVTLSNFTDYMLNTDDGNLADAIICHEGFFNFDFEINDEDHNIFLEDYKQDEDARQWTLFFDHYVSKFNFDNVRFIYLTSRDNNPSDLLYLERLQKSYGIHHILNTEKLTEQDITEAVMS